MKRILAIAITLVIVLAALTGCTASGNHLDKSLQITLTIAETLPSCPAFESDCFYAFDAEGVLYRVLWTDFTDLDEKDTVVIEYSKKEKLNISADLTGGFHAKYAITANSVKKALFHSGYEVEVELFQYTWDGWGISTKKVGACDVAYNIIDALKAMKETGEIVPKISDEVFEVGGGQYSAERGTMWIESSGNIYRLTSDLSQICLVETHFGEGKVLEITDEFKTNVNNAWYYAPYDYYKGTYNKGDYTVDLESIFKSGSTVQLSIKKIQIESGYDPTNTITVELISSVDQEVNIKLNCQQSDDNLAAGDYRTVQLKEGEPTTVDLTFGGWQNSTYWVYIEADSTKAEITINS